MAAERSLQHDMFSGDLVDTRSRRQRKRDREREQPKQAEMFSQRDIAQFGVKANPKLPLSPLTKLELSIMDLRSEEEKEQDRMREAEKNTHRLPEVRDEAGTTSP